jgi:hypothetical protein
MMGSQSGGRQNDGPALPGMENLGEDAIMMGGIEVNENIPEGMEFIPSSVPDGEIAMQVAASGKGTNDTSHTILLCFTVLHITLFIVHESNFSSHDTILFH